MRRNARQKKWLLVFMVMILFCGCQSKDEYQNFTLMDHDQAFITLKQLRLTREAAAGWLLSPDIEMAGAFTGKEGRVVFAAATYKGYRTGVVRPNPPFSKVPANLQNGDQFFEFSGVFFTSTELRVTNQQVLSYTQKTQWEKADRMIPGGLYDWYVGDSGILLLQGNQGLLVNFQTALKVTPADRQKTVFSVFPGKPDTLIVSLANQEISLKSRVDKLGKTPFQLPEPSPAVIEGKAFWKDKKTPLRWVNLELKQWSSNVGETTPDENGNFRFTGVHPGNYSLFGRRGDTGDWCPLSKTGGLETFQVLGGVVSVGTVYAAGWCEE